MSTCSRLPVKAGTSARPAIRSGFSSLANGSPRTCCLLIPHRQYVFTIPKMLRVYFRTDRRLLGKLSQCAYASIKAFFQAAVKKPQAVPGVIVAIQTFGDLVNFHPHLHAIVSEGLFAANGWLYVVPDIDLKKLEQLFRHKVLTMLR